MRGNLFSMPGLDSRMRGNDMQRDRPRAILAVHAASSILLFSAILPQRTILRAVQPSAQAMAFSRKGTAGNGRASHCGKEKQ
mgnify:CR=1 FL=1